MIINDINGHRGALIQDETVWNLTCCEIWALSASWKCFSPTLLKLFRLSKYIHLWAWCRQSWSAISTFMAAWLSGKTRRLWKDDAPFKGCPSLLLEENPGKLIWLPSTTFQSFLNAFCRAPREDRWTSWSSSWENACSSARFSEPVQMI